MGLTFLHIPRNKRELLRPAIISAGIECEEVPLPLGSDWKMEVWRCRGGGVSNYIYILPYDEAMPLEREGVPVEDLILRIVMKIGFLGLFRLRKFHAAQHRLISLLVANGATFIGSNHLPPQHTEMSPSNGQK